MTGNHFKSVAAVTALTALLFVFGGRAEASMINVLFGLPWTSETSLNNFGSANVSEPLTFTDGGTTSSNAGTFDFINYGGATVVYDLGPTPPVVNEFAMWDGLGDQRGGPALVTIDFSNDPTFATGVTTDVVHLPDNLDGSASAYYQTALISSVAKEYVRFTFPDDPNFKNGPTDFSGLTAEENSSDGYYNVQSDPNFATVSELELYFVPEPASLGLLAIGGVMLLCRRGGGGSFS